MSSFWVPRGTLEQDSSLASGSVHSETRVEHLPQKDHRVLWLLGAPLTPQQVTLSAITGCQERGLERAIPELSRHERVQGDEAGAGGKDLRKRRRVRRICPAVCPLSHSSRAPRCPSAILEYLDSAYSSCLPGPDGRPLQTRVMGHVSVSRASFSGLEDVKWYLSQLVRLYTEKSVQ